MTERERVLSILRHEQPDQLPWLADLAYWTTYLERNQMLPKNWSDDLYVQMSRELGSGFYLQGFQPFREITKNVETKLEKQGNVEIQTITTPVGTLRQVSQYSR